MDGLNGGDALEKLLEPQQESLTIRGTEVDPDEPIHYHLDPDPVIDTSCPGCFQVSMLGNLASFLCLPITVLSCCGFTVRGV